jgi:hypothetical protein
VGLREKRERKKERTVCSCEEGSVVAAVTVVQTLVHCTKIGALHKAEESATSSELTCEQPPR